MLLSVVIPVYNGGYYLGRALESIRQQGKVDDIECLIVDDGSSDNTLDVVEEYKKYLSIRLINKGCDQEKGWVSSTNIGLKNACGEYCCFLHQDDLWLPDRMDFIRTSISRFSSASLLLSSAQFIDACGKMVCMWRPSISVQYGSVPVRLLRKKMLVQNLFAINAPVFKLDIVRQLGGLDPRLWYTADWDFWLKLLMSVDDVVYSQKPSVAFRVHATSITATQSKRTDVFESQMQEVLSRYSHLPEFDSVVEKAAVLSISVNVCLARALHSERVFYSVAKLLVLFVKSEWSTVKAYFMSSCIHQRLWARLVSGFVWF